MSKTHVQSIRMSDETKEKFLQLKEGLGLSQDDLIATLIQVYELNQAKEVIPEQAASIEQLQSYLNGIRNQYLSILEMNTFAEERIRQKFSIRLENNEKTFNDLNEKIKEGQEAIIKKDEELQEAREKIKSLKFLEEEIHRCLESIRDKNMIITNMNEKIELLEHIQNEYQFLQKEYDDLKEKYNEINIQYHNLKNLNNQENQENKYKLQLKQNEIDLKEKELKNREKEIEFLQIQVQETNQRIEELKNNIDILTTRCQNPEDK